MRFTTTSMTTLLAIAGLSGKSWAIFGPKGINNRGSSQCNGDNIAEIAGYINNLPDSQLYESGYHIACSSNHGKAGFGGHCAFLQKTSQPYSGRQIKLLIQMLNEKDDTKECGSVPVSLLPEFGSINELEKLGFLTVNYVLDTDNPCPPGVCGASIPPDHQGQCPVLDAPTKRHVANSGIRKSRRQSSRLGKRDLTPSSAIEAGSRLLTQAGLQLDVRGLVPTEPSGNQCPLVGSFFTELVPGLAQSLQGLRTGFAFGTAAPYKLVAAIETLSGDLDALALPDLEVLIGAMAQRMSRDRLQAVEVRLFTVTGVAAMTASLFLWNV